MDLLSSAQRAKIKGAVKDVTDTFAKKQITYNKTGETLDRFNNDRINNNAVQIELLGLVVWNSSDTSTDSKFTESKKQLGKYDYSQGYILFNNEDLVAAGLIVNNVFQGNPETDTVEFDGSKYVILGENMIGQFSVNELVFKIHIRKDMKANG